MMSTQQTFLQFLQMALWGKSVEEFSWPEYGKIDWEGIAQLSLEQTQMGLIAEAWAQLPKEKRPAKTIFFSQLAKTADIEKENGKVNALIPNLMKVMAQAGCQPWLLKGQAVGRYYRNPMLRHAGDIDLLLTNEEQYQRAMKCMEQLTGEKGKESFGRQHSEFWVKDILVELHGIFTFTICRKCTRHLASWRERHLKEQPIMVSVNQKPIFLPPVMFEVVFVFAHMMNHLMTGGVGLRQVTDCMMLMYKQYEHVNEQQLREELDSLGLIKFWKTYASMVVDFIGYPADRMPLYDVTFHHKGEKMLNLIFKTGNFGHLQKEKQLSSDSNRILKKVVTAWGQVPVYWRAAQLFPVDALYCFWKYSVSAMKE